MVVAFVIAMAATITKAISAAQKRSLTITRLDVVDAALIQFVSQVKRLPCPANGTLPSTDANVGLEVRNANGGCSVNVATAVTLQHGIVPWRTLGLTEADASDGWDRRLTYRLQPGLAADSAMDMSWCDPAGTGAAVGATQACNSTGACSSASAAGLASCTPPSAFLANKGLPVRRVDGVTIVMNPAAAPHTGAAYVVISHGETGGGAYLSSGSIATSTVTDGTSEAMNYANLTYVAGTTFYIDDAINENSGNAHFDDVVRRPSLLAVISRAGLGPRSH